jgi:hypothetical protein
MHPSSGLAASFCDSISREEPPQHVPVSPRVSGYAIMSAFQSTNQL